MNYVMNYVLCFQQTGFRLIAISILPINRSTIVYGSNDGGQTVHAEDEAFNLIMERAAKVLNLAGHQAGINHAHTKLLYSAADIEGHKGQVRKAFAVRLCCRFRPKNVCAGPSLLRNRLFS